MSARLFCLKPGGIGYVIGWTRSRCSYTGYTAAAVAAAAVRGFTDGASVDGRVSPVG